MTSWIPSSIQKRLLRYALSRTGLLDDRAIDLADLDITLGKQNVVVLQNVGLNIDRLEKLAQLPPQLKIDTARVLSLRLTVPANVSQSSIIAEADGVELSVRLEEGVVGSQEDGQERLGSPVSARGSTHKRRGPRTHSTPARGWQGSFKLQGESGPLPTTRDLAQSFLHNEPLQERRQLEASVAAKAGSLEDSIASDSTEGGELGTGAGIGLPGFLAGFLQGIVDRLQLKIRNVRAKVEVELSSDDSMPLALTLHIGDAGLEAAKPDDSGYRTVRLNDLALDLLSNATAVSQLSETQPSSSPHAARSFVRSTNEASNTQRSSESTVEQPTSVSASRLDGSNYEHSSALAAQTTPEIMEASIATADSDRFADAGENEDISNSQGSLADMDIKPGEDNLSFAARRSQGSTHSVNLWDSVASDEDLPDSLLFDAGRPSSQSTTQSQQNSPNSRTKPRAVSPYARNTQSPGSWPRLDLNPAKASSQQGPGSWPTIDQERQSVFQPLTPGPRLKGDDDPLDNKQKALEHANERPSDSTIADTREQDDSSDGMATSKFFSYEEAESMYMSALTQDHSPKMTMPGQWGSDDSSTSQRSLSPVISRRHEIRRDPTPRQDPPATAPALADGVRSPPGSHQGVYASDAETPGAGSTYSQNSASTPSPEDQCTTKRLLHVDYVSIQFLSRTRNAIPQTLSSNAGDNGHRAHTSSTTGEIPGAFSAYSERHPSRRSNGESGSSEAGSVVFTSSQDITSEKTQTTRVQVGAVDGWLDLSLGKMLDGLVSKFAPLLKQDKRPPNETHEATSPPHHAGMLSLSIENLGLHLCHDVQAAPRNSRDSKACNDVVTLTCADAFFVKKPEAVEFGAGRLTILTGGYKMLSFSRDRNMQSSMVIRPDTPDIAVEMFTSSEIHQQSSTRVQFTALPIVLDIDIQVLEDAFASFGGLSGILELGCSVLSDDTATNVSRKPVKGVRFANERPSNPESAEFKAQGRIEGAQINLRASACAMTLRSTAFKLVHRAERSGVSVNQIRLEGPHGGDATPSIIDIEGVKLDYLTVAAESDVERLLSLLTPRKDKYDNDDDIMIDTLVRQRRKGAVARLTIDKTRINVADLNSLALLQDLGAEIGQVSAVAKYLPEDERPGLMTLIRLKELDARVPVNDRFGNTVVRARDLSAAHVGLPALFALAVSGVRIADNSDHPLVHTVVPLTGGDDSPMIMARMLGNEAEPAVKIKLYNVCLEYSVTTLLALTDKDEQPTAEEMAAALARSVAALTIPSPSAEPQDSDDPLSLATPPAAPSKRTNIKLLLHDCAIGLTPNILTSKALLVLTDARASTTVPPEETLSASLELRRSAIFLTDNAGAIVESNATLSSSAVNNTAATPRLALVLANRGYASVGSIVSAKLNTSVSNTRDGDKSVGIYFTNKLLLLETCADSTQTLIAILGALSPPSTPSKLPQYLTEPTTIQDMLASFSGDAVEKPEGALETLFDLDKETGPANALEANIATSSDLDDDLLTESEIASSLYGPVSGMLTGVDAPVDDDHVATNYQGTAESLLEEDPFEMPNSPTDMKLTDHQLIRDLKGQCKLAADGEPVDIALLEIDDLGTEALEPEQAALGTKYRFAPPSSRALHAAPSENYGVLPFKLRVHDCHVIWNIHDGYDWQRTQDGITDAVEQIERRAEEKKTRRQQSRNDLEDDESVIGDCLFNSIYIGVPSNHDAQALRRQINHGIDPNGSETETESLPVSGMSRPTAYSAGGRPGRQRQQRRLKLERSREHKVAFELKGVSADVLVFDPDSGEVQSSVDVRLKEFEIFDHIPTSTWHKFLTCLTDEQHAREMSKPMVHLQLSNVKTLQQYAATEVVLRVTILPLRLHVDQDTLDFITRFFEFKDDSMATSGDAEQPFLQRVEIDTVDLRLEYKPKTVDYAGIRSGHTTEFMNFINLEACDIRLNHAIVYGIKGFEPLHKILNDVWTPDVKRNQLPRILAGLAPVRGIVNLGTGMRDVVAIPIREYRRDGRVVRNIQKGAFHFAKTTTSELARLGAKMAMGTQNMLSNAETLLGPSPSSSPYSRGAAAGSSDDAEARREYEQRAISAYADQPISILSGFRSARQRLEHDLLTAKDAFIAVQGEVFDSRDPTSAAAAVVKHGPTVILRPVIGASRAVGTTLMGLGNQIDRGNVGRMEDVSSPSPFPLLFFPFLRYFLGALLGL